MKADEAERLEEVRAKRAMVVKEWVAKRRGMWEPIIGLFERFKLVVSVGEQ